MRKLITPMLLALLIIGVLHSPLPEVDATHWAWRDTSLWSLLFPQAKAYRSSIIKYIERDSCNASASACNITINQAVVVLSSIVQYNGMSTADAGTVLSQGHAQGVLSSTTNIAVSATVTNGTTINFQLTEYYPDVFTANGVQRGTINMNGDTSDTATADTIGGKAGLISCGTFMNAGVDTARVIEMKGAYADPTVTVTRNTSQVANDTYCYQVADWK